MLVITKRFLRMQRGDRINGRKLEIYEMPGHTLGSVILVDRDDKICFSGDAIIEGMEKIISGDLKGVPVETTDGNGIEYAYKDWKVICKK